MCDFVAPGAHCFSRTVLSENSEHAEDSEGKECATMLIFLGHWEVLCIFAE